jgi:hypothetical protein
VCLRNIYETHAGKKEKVLQERAQIERAKSVPPQGWNTGMPRLLSDSRESKGRRGRLTPFQPTIMFSTQNLAHVPDYLLVYVVESLSCGHKITIYPQADLLIAARRDCKDCEPKILPFPAPVTTRKKAA